MKTQQETTGEYILRIVAPLFNKKGYVATSLSDLEKATGLTKGAIYRNFKSKEDLAVQAFKQNIRRVIAPLSAAMEAQSSIPEKLFTLTDYYRKYFHKALELGGCPLLNISVDAHYTNPELFQKAKKVTNNIENSLEQFISDGIANGEINPAIDARIYAQKIFSMIQGSVFLAFLNEDSTYTENMMDQIDQMIKTEMMV
ncbi:TetR/AcrR family transcriptional regulator [Limibacter armeniacum]|uniref:TetR/AcrR family transcriptional regulator n=1 Tax=Limibacter armeniacum TaxID=466084 RepID=UPI002FE66C82